MPDRQGDPQDRDELAARIEALEAENARLREQLAACDRTNASLCEHANRGWARVATLAARTRRLLRLAKYWRTKCPTRPLSDHLKAIMMARYAALGGLERGRGIGAVEQVAEEFGVRAITVHRCIREFKHRKVTKAETHRIVENYRRRFGD